MRKDRSICWWTAMSAVALSLQASVAVTASIDCEAVLRDGVFDRFQVRGLRGRIEQAKAAICGTTASSQTYSVDIIGGLTAEDRATLCSASTDRLESDPQSQAIVDRVSALVSNAFNECAVRNVGGVSHGVFTTEDPGAFTYHVQFVPDPSGEARRVDVDSFEVHNATCRPPLSGETVIGEGRRTLICTRDPEDAVIIGLNTVGNRGSRYLEPIRLGAFARPEPVTSRDEAVARVPPPAPAGKRYSRFSARRQLSESSCNDPVIEFTLEETRQVKLVGKAIAQGGGLQYPLWIEILVNGEARCEQQAWSSRRGTVTEECFIWVEANQPVRVQAVQGSRDASCVSTDLEIWH